jgi:hypothetical protein
MNDEILIMKCEECLTNQFEICYNTFIKQIVFICNECGSHYHYDEIKELLIKEK